jgi:hypothetical protein
MKRLLKAVLSVVMAVSGGAVLAQESTHGDSGGCGDLFGDLIHIKRNSMGQPILQKAWVALQGGGYGYAYCPIAVDKNGQELPFLAAAWDATQNRWIESCDVALESAPYVVPVDYFGRLSGGRTKERNIRMHLDEVIANIKMAQLVDREVTGRLMLGSLCALDSKGAPIASTCSWKAVDSPQENIAVYQRIMKYGHLQTDPREPDPAAGDPKALPAFRPALDATDRAKFRGSVRTLLPNCGEDDVPPTDPTTYPATPWACAQPESLSAEDFVFLAGTLAAAGDKTGSVSVDLVQYFNRIVRVDKSTEFAVAAKDLLPALYRPSPWNLDTAKAEVVNTLYPGSADLPFPANERFLNYGAVFYVRDLWFNAKTGVIKPDGTSTTKWVYDPNVMIKKYLVYANPWWTSDSENRGITGFVYATEDSLRTTEFFHNYAVPLDLGWNFR